MVNIFLSHSSSDKLFVRRLAEDLRTNDVKVWIDEAEIQIGDSLIRKIQEGITSADFVGAILSQASVKSRWVQHELENAITREISGSFLKVLPIVIEECEIPAFLSSRKYADFRNENDYPLVLANLLRAMGIKPVLGKSAGEVPREPIQVSGPFEPNFENKLTVEDYFVVILPSTLRWLGTAATDLDKVVGFEIKDQPGAPRYNIELRSPEARVRWGSRGPKPDLIIAIDRGEFEKILAGTFNAREAILGGAIELSGDLKLLKKVGFLLQSFSASGVTS